MLAVLGIDTSNYTTSAALVSLKGQILADKRRLLPVKSGEVGLRQSDALFLHVKQWPDILAELAPIIATTKIEAVAYSAKPRPLPDSYMPTFLVGSALAQTMASILQVPLLPFTHQEGHMRAALFGINTPPQGPFIAIHISGGTTDILLVSPTGASGYNIATLGESTDLHAGQFVDRVGVAMGLDFPCGKAMEEIALKEQLQPFNIPSSVCGMKISFSGPLSAAQRALDEGIPAWAVAQGVFRCISNSLEKVLVNLPPDAPRTIVLCGGVASNSYIRERLESRLRRYSFILSQVPLASDNAVGVALLGYDSLTEKRSHLC